MKFETCVSFSEQDRFNEIDVREVGVVFISPREP